MASYISFLCNGKWTEVKNCACFSMFRRTCSEFLPFYVGGAPAGSVIEGVSMVIPAEERHLVPREHSDNLLYYLATAKQFGGKFKVSYRDCSITFYDKDADSNLIAAVGAVFRNLLEYPDESALFYKLCNDGIDKDYAFLYSHSCSHKRGSRHFFERRNHVPVYLSKEADDRKRQAKEWKAKRYKFAHSMQKKGYKGISCFFTDTDHNRFSDVRMNSLSYKGLVKEISSI